MRFTSDKMKVKSEEEALGCAPASPLLSWVGAEGCSHSCPCRWVLMKTFSYNSNPKSKWKQL